MKSIKQTQTLQRENCKQIVNACYWQHLSFLIIFFSKKTDMKFIILVSNLKPSDFSWKKKEYIKNYDAILLSKYDSAEKRY